MQNILDVLNDNLIQIPSIFGSGDAEQIQRLINSKVDLNLGDYDSRTAIHLVNYRQRLHCSNLSFHGY